MDAATQPVTRTRCCETRGIDPPRAGPLTAPSRGAFPGAAFYEDAGEWRILWEKGPFAESNARDLFASIGIDIIQVDKC